MIDTLSHLLQRLSEMESAADADARRAKAEGDTVLYEWYDGFAHGLLRAKELIQDDISSKEESE